MKTLILRSLLSAASVLALSSSVMNAEPKRINEQDGLRAVVSRVAPVYPPMAKQLKLAGRVVVDMTVAENGSVESADVVNGNPILAAAAKSAASNWRFKPFQEDGKSAKAVVRVNFDFTN